MLPLRLFRSRNFAVGNAATLTIYGGLGAATFFVTIFLQQVAGYGAVAAGSSLMPITIVMWLLSRRFGALSDRIGPRLLMGLGPIVAGIGLIWMGRLDADVDYLTELLPGVLLFALGLSATVAPLTNTVLGAVPQHNAGVASGVNNQVARVASLLAIAAVGAIVASTYDADIDERVAGTPLAGDPVVAEVKDRPLSGGVDGRPELDAPSRTPRSRPTGPASARRRPRDPRRDHGADRHRQPAARGPAAARGARRGQVGAAVPGLSRGATRSGLDCRRRWGTA